jgi:hypothetical protein
MIKIPTLLLVAMAAALPAKADQPTQVEQLYLSQLQSWLDEGADPTTVQE